MARDLIQQNLSRSQAVEKMAEFQFHNTRKPQPGGDRSGPASRPATTKPYQEQAQEEMRGSGALPSHMAVWHSEEKGVAGTPSQATELSTPAWSSRSFARN